VGRGQDRELEVGDGVGGDVLVAAVGWFGRVPKPGRMWGGRGKRDAELADGDRRVRGTEGG